MDIYFTILLGLSVSMDALFAGMSYGFKGVSLKKNAFLVLGMVTCGCTAAAMWCARLLGQFLDLRLAMLGGAAILIGLGFWNLFQEYFTKSLLDSDYETSSKQLIIHLGRMMVCIRAKPETADIDGSRDISCYEALLLGLALGLDNMVAIFAASLLKILPWYSPGVMGLTQVLLIFGGLQIVRLLKFSSYEKYLAYLPGTILVILGLLRLR